MSENEYPKTVVVAGCEVEQTGEGEWWGTNRGADVDFTISYDPAADEGDNYTVDLFHAEVEDVEAAHFHAFGAATLEEAVESAVEWILDSDEVETVVIPRAALNALLNAANRMQRALSDTPARQYRNADVLNAYNIAVETLSLDMGGGDIRRIARHTK